VATSGSVDYSLTRSALIKESMQLVGAISEGIDPNDTQYLDASRTLNIMVKAWQAYGLNLWTIETASISCVIGSGVCILSNCQGH